MTGTDTCLGPVRPKPVARSGSPPCPSLRRPGVRLRYVDLARISMPPDVRIRQPARQARQRKKERKPCSVAKSPIRPPKRATARWDRSICWRHCRLLRCHREGRNPCRPQPRRPSPRPRYRLFCPRLRYRLPNRACARCRRIFQPNFRRRLPPPSLPPRASPNWPARSFLRNPQNRRNPQCVN